MVPPSPAAASAVLPAPAATVPSSRAVVAAGEEKSAAEGSVSSCDAPRPQSGSLTSATEMLQASAQMAAARLSVEGQEAAKKAGGGSPDLLRLRNSPGDRRSSAAVGPSAAATKPPPRGSPASAISPVVAKAAAAAARARTPGGSKDTQRLLRPASGPRVSAAACADAAAPAAAAAAPAPARAAGGGDGQAQQLGEDVDLSVEELRAAVMSKAADVAARPCLVEAGPETMSGGAGAPLPTGGPEIGGGNGGSGGGTRSGATAAAGGGVVNGDTSSPLIGWEEPAACRPPSGSRRKFKSGGEAAGTSVPAGRVTGAGRGGGTAGPAPGECSSARSAGHGGATAGAAADPAEPAGRESGPDVVSGARGKGIGGVGLAGRRGGSRNASKFPDDVIAKVKTCLAKFVVFRFPSAATLRAAPAVEARKRLFIGVVPHAVWCEISIQRGRGQRPRGGRGLERSQERCCVVVRRDIGGHAEWTPLHLSSTYESLLSATSRSFLLLCLFGRRGCSDAAVTDAPAPRPAPLTPPPRLSAPPLFFSAISLRKTPTDTSAQFVPSSFTNRWMDGWMDG